LKIRSKALSKDCGVAFAVAGSTDQLSPLSVDLKIPFP
jgi:hypothetical protein